MKILYDVRGWGSPYSHHIYRTRRNVVTYIVEDHVQIISHQLQVENKIAPVYTEEY